MTKYIDADKLIAEIDRLNSLVSYESKDRHDEGLHDAYKAIKNVIYSLQQEQPEVDLEKITKFSRIKELPDGFEKNWLKYYHTDKEYNSVKFHHLSTLEREYIIARHFWNEGYNARKK